MPFSKRIYLSPPHMSGRESALVAEAFESNWIAPLGPHVDLFEQEFSSFIDSHGAVALSSGTAALHLALILSGVGPGDEVIVSTFTFCASVNPVIYTGASPIFIDSETESWNMDPYLLQQALSDRARAGRVPKAVVLVHLYGQSANIQPILDLCEEYGIVLIEDAAESLGATYMGQQTGNFGQFGVFSFNGNKIITTSGGGMLVAKDRQLLVRARKLATQAREPVIHYEHKEVGYNYRMSNVLAGIGRGQLAVLNDRVSKRRSNCEKYKEHLSDIPGISFMPEAPWGKSSRWLTCILIDPVAFGADRDRVYDILESHNVESRPLWKPMHQQPAYSKYKSIVSGVADRLFEKGLCLPSGSDLSDNEIYEISLLIKKVNAHA